jgi:hypothetical protein
VWKVAAWRARLIHSPPVGGSWGRALLNVVVPGLIAAWLGVGLVDEDVLALLHAHSAELVGKVEQYEDSYRLCYVRGQEGIIVALAEQLS